MGSYLREEKKNNLMPRGSLKHRITGQPPNYKTARFPPVIVLSSARTSGPRTFLRYNKWVMSSFLEPL